MLLSPTVQELCLTAMILEVSSQKIQHKQDKDKNEAMLCRKNNK